MFRRSNIDLTEDMPPQTLGPINPSRRGIDGGTHPEGEGYGLLGPADFRRDLLDAERRMQERKQADKRRGAAEHVEWTRQHVDAAQRRIAQAELTIKHDLNPFGRGRRHAEQEIVIARAKADLADWTDEHADAVKKVRALGVTESGR